MKDNLSRAVKSGVAWTIVERAALQFLNLLTSIVLARLLSPDDFGVMGLAILFSGLATRLVKFGFGMALVQRETIRPDHVATMFVVTLIINSLICVSLLLASPFVGSYFGNPLVGQVIAVMSFNFIIRCVGICPSALLRREMNFKAMTVGSILDYTVKLGLASLLAFQDFGVWSLAYGELAGGMAEKVYLVLAARWHPSLRATSAALQDLFSFGMGVSLKSTFIYLSENVDNFIVGKSLGSGALGFYEKAYNLMDMPVKELSTRMNAVLFPVFARIHQDPGRLRAAFRKTILSLSLLCYPIFGSLFILAPQIIHLMYGPKWASTAVPFQILSLVGFPRVLTQITGAVINATGSVGPEVKRRGLIFILLIVAALVGSRWGIVGVAMAVVLVNLITLALILFLLVRSCPVALEDILVPQRLPIAGGLVLIVLEKSCQLWTVRILGWNPFWSLGASLVVGCSGYLIVLYLLQDGPLIALAKELIGDVRPVLNRLQFAFVKRFR